MRLLVVGGRLWAPAEATNANTPIALACSRGRGNIVTIMPRITALVSAPPIPCRNRAVTSIAWFAASPHTREATVKPATDTRKTRFKPNRPVIQPASGVAIAAATM